MVEPKQDICDIDPDELVQVRKIVKDLADEEIDLHIKPASVVDKHKDALEKLTCQFCNSVATDPIQDLNCSHCFCRTCARSNLTKGAECPVPRCGEIFQERELTKYFKSEFEGLNVACEHCHQVHPFNQTLTHRKTCFVKPTPCINNCGDGRLYKGFEAHLAHITNDCQKAKVICQRCKTKSIRLAIKGHNCVLGLINQVKNDNADSLKTALSEINADIGEKVSNC